MLTKAALYHYLVAEIFPQLVPPPYGSLRVGKISRQKQVYLFCEKINKITVIGKIFKNPSVSLEKAWMDAEREYHNLKLAREKFGMNNAAYRVVTPLGKKRGLSCLLITEKAPGETLDHYIAKAIYEHQTKKLFEKLSNLAKFLAILHKNSESERAVSLDLPRHYLDKLMNSLSKNILSELKEKAIERYSSEWWRTGALFTGDKEVMVHGDATPTNFLFYHDEVIGIDLEKMKYADRCWDLGFVAAELKHHFAWRLGSGWSAEPFIGHFLWEYAMNLKDALFFRSITRRIPFYMALGLLRIARNPWLDETYRKNLLGEAKGCLKYGL
jgi:aminoglycoside phosphotransferase (APT) family kinase protein